MIKNIVLISASFLLFYSCCRECGKTYSVGDLAQGGIVFWVDETGHHGLVCPKQDQHAHIRWYAGIEGETGAYSDGPFTGKINTAMIIVAHIAIGSDHRGTYAARICNELEITEDGITYSDWYLPSLKEVDLMYQNREMINAISIANGGSEFNRWKHWSSTESMEGSAYAHVFDAYGGFMVEDKCEGLAVRAVRSF